MFLSMNWIGDFVDLTGLDRRSLIRNFTLSTAEVEDIYEKGTDTHGVIAASIITVDPHPSSKKLHLLTVDTGSGILNVVCGAPNVRPGMRVAFAPSGSAVCGKEITTATVGGYTSQGMCCSEAELGISDNNSGLFEITDDIPLGTDLKTVYDIDDIVFEVDNKSLTNRPDLWGHFGIARELATITGRPLKAPKTVDLDRYSLLPEVPVDVRATELVWRYTAIAIDNIKRKTSPVNMRIRLFYCGSRAINLLADLTNYVMLELGQPMHAFDRHRVEKIEVQTPAGDGTFVTLDGVSRKTDKNTLLITSGDTPVALAGIMGGDASKIEDDTDSLLLESATFDGVCVRKTSSRIGLRTDASMRYEKMLDPELCATASARFIYLLTENDPGARVVSRFSDCYVRHYPKITLDFDKKYVDRYTGIDIPSDTIEKTLTGLGFGIKRSGDSFSVTVPTWRATKDVTIKADIIEEITRIYGYDNFEIFTSVSPLRPVRTEVQKSDEDRIKDILVKSYRLHEVHSYIWSDEAENSALGITTPENVKIINAQTPEHRYIRRSMIPTLLSFVAKNRTFSDTFGIFEIGHTAEGYLPSGRANEIKKLGVVLFSRSGEEQSLFSDATNAICEIIADTLHKTPDFTVAETETDYQHPENMFRIVVDGVDLGYLSSAYPTVTAAIDKKCAIVFFEINTDALAKLTVKPIHYTEPTKFPGIDIDLTFTVNIATVNFNVLREAAESVCSPLLSGVRVKDIYGEGAVAALTVRFSFESPERTLTKSELQPDITAIIDKFAEYGIVCKSVLG